MHVPGKLALMGKEHEMVLGIDTNGSFFAGRNRYNGSPFKICRPMARWIDMVFMNGRI